MRFTVQNLGGLEEATIDLGKDLIVLTGPNNTSKTYVAHAIYGFCRTLHSFPIARAVIDAVPPPNRRFPIRKITERLTVDALEIMERFIGADLERMASQYANHLADVFASGSDFFKKTSIRVDIDENDRAAARQSVLERKAHVVASPETFEIDVLTESGQWIFSRFVKKPTSSTQAEQLRHQFSVPEFAHVQINAFLIDVLFWGLTIPHILTAERAAIQLFSRELSLRRSDILDAVLKSLGETDPVSILKDRARRYPLAIRDGLRQADDLAASRKMTSSFEKEAVRFERELLQGSIRVDEAGEMTFAPSQANESLTMHLASSSVKALSGLSFYLRHLAQPGQFLIIDEPELNLHPHNQRLVARLLARLARLGIKVMISTHSDYIIRELNNLLMLSADKNGAVRKKYGYDKDEMLDPERVGAYLFDGARAHSIPIEPAGIAVAEIDKEIRDLNRSSRGIYAVLYEADPS